MQMRTKIRYLIEVILRRRGLVIVATTATKGRTYLKKAENYYDAILSNENGSFFAMLYKQSQAQSQEYAINTDDLDGRSYGRCLFKLLWDSMTKFVFFQNNLKHFNSTEEIQCYAQRHHPNLFSVSHRIRSGAEKEQQENRRQAKGHLQDIWTKEGSFVKFVFNGVGSSKDHSDEDHQSNYIQQSDSKEPRKAFFFAHDPKPHFAIAGTGKGKATHKGLSFLHTSLDT